MRFLLIMLDYFSSTIPENGELPGLSAVTLPHDESGIESDFKQSEGHDSEQLSSSFVPAAPCN